MALIAKFFKLSSADKLLLTYCMLIVAMIRIGLSLFSYRTLRRHLQQRVGKLPASDADARRIIWAVANSARIVPHASCLTQAFAAQFLLTRAGHRSQMRVGVAKDGNGKFVAHVWLISKGCVVIGGSASELRRYTALTDLSLEPP